MCLAMAAGSSLLGWTGAILSGFGAYQQGRNAAASARYEAEASRANAQITEYKKAEADRLADLKKDEIRKQQAKLQGRARTQYAAGNVALGAGSPADYEADLAEGAGADVDAVEEDRKSRLWGLDVEKTGYLNRANAFESSVSGYKTAGILGFGSSILKAGYDFGFGVAKKKRGT